MMLGRKQSISNGDWLEALDQIEELVPRGKLDPLIERTLEDIRKHTLGKKAAYCWSGGKDSILLGDLCRTVGIMDCMLAICDLEYPAFMEWVEANKPESLEIINTGQDMKYLENHLHLLFPADSKAANPWFTGTQHKAQNIYFKEHGLDMLILGRRKADGNYCGNGSGSNMYTNKNGVTRYSPLAWWSHEEILAYIHYNNLPMPPIYGWPNGFLCGTHQWPARQWTGSIENGWREVYEIDPDIVVSASKSIESAREFLSSLEP